MKLSLFVTTMFAKFCLIFVFTAFVSAGHALPGGHNHDDSSEEHHHGHGKGQKHDKGNEHQHHHGEGPYGSHPDLKLNPNSPFMKVKNLTEELYTEIFALASGDNYASPEVSNDVHINARAIVLLSQKLHDMQTVYPILFNVTIEYATKGVKVTDKETMVDLINDLTTQVKIRCPHFESLKSSLTDSFITRGKYFKAGATQQEKAAAYEKWLMDPFMCTAAMNKLFYRAILKDDKPQYKILQAIVTKVVRDDDSKEKLEQIYADVTAKTVEKICPAHEPRKAAFVFYQKLMEQLAEDATLLIALYTDNDDPSSTIFTKPF